MNTETKSLMFLHKKLELLSKLFEGIKISYEYREASKSHIIEIIPKNLYENDNSYRRLESSIEDEFEQDFPDEEILFITEDSLIKIVNPTLFFAWQSIEEDVVNADECFVYGASMFSAYHDYANAELINDSPKEDNNNSYALAA